MTTDCEERLEIVTTIERAEEIAGAWIDIWQDAQAGLQNHAWVMGVEGNRPRAPNAADCSGLARRKARCGAAAWSSAQARPLDARMGRAGFLRLLRCNCAPRRRSGRAAADVGLLWSAAASMSCNSIDSSDGGGARLLGDGSSCAPHTRDELSLRVVGPGLGARPGLTSRRRSSGRTIAGREGDE